MHRIPHLRLALFVATGLALFMPGAAQALITYVDAGASGAGTGSSWSDAFVTLQDALVSAGPGTEIWVAAGTYTPDLGAGQTPGARTSSFELRPGVALYGGFAGIETARIQRDPALHLTVLSGDLQANDQPNWVHHGDNAYHVVRAPGVDASAILDGFHVYGGYAEVASGWDSTGGGLLLLGGSPTIANCRFRENLAHSGAAMGAFPGSPQVSRSSFEGNYAWTGRGGAVYNDAGSSPVFSDCRFSGNRSWGASSVGDGGAMFNSGGTAVRLERCVFTGNSSSASSAIYSNGGALCNLGDGLVVLNCGFFGNDAMQAGGVWTGGDATFVNTIFSGNTSLFGGGMEIFFATVTLANCDFSLNDASDGGGVALGIQGHGIFRNCILWGNTATQAPSEFKAQVHKADDSASTSFRYSSVQGIFTAEPGEDPPDPANFPGCTEADPLFTDENGADNVAGTEDDDLHLLPGSPCVDAAENAGVPPGTTVDLAGAPRFFNDPCTVDHGLGTPPLVDMGAYEFPTSSCTSVAQVESGAGGDRNIVSLTAAPTPFASACRIALRLTAGSQVAVDVLDVTGRRVRNLGSRRLEAGDIGLTWDGRDDHGDALPAGLYFVRVTSGTESRTGKVIRAR